MLVVAAHAKVAGLAGGFVGVDVFFVLSGFLMTGLIASELDARRGFDFSAFYARRLRRLLPALLLVLLATAMAAMLLLPPAEQALQAYAARLVPLWLSNFHFAAAELDYFGPQAESQLMLHTWSLAVEEQFYLFWPVLILAVLGFWSRSQERSSTRAVLAVLAAIGVLSLLLSLLLLETSPKLAFYMVYSRVWQFVLGGLAFFAGRELTANATAARRMTGVAGPLALMGIVGIVASAALVDEATPYPGTWALLPCVSTVMVLIGFQQGAAPGIGFKAAAALLENPVSQFLGRVSYGWYLWHWPVLLLGHDLLPSLGGAAPLALAVVALLLATLSYYLLERPVRRAAAPARHPRLALLVGAVLMAMAWQGLALWQARAERMAEDPQQLAWQRVRGDLAPIYAHGCDDWYMSATVKPCILGDPAARKSLVLWGDSVGVQWFSALAPVTQGGEWRLVVLTKSSCPILDGEYFYARIGRRFVECEQWREDVLQWLRANPPDMVLFGSNADTGITPERWREGTRVIAGRLAGIAQRTIVLAPTPKVSFDGPACLSRQAWLPAWLKQEDACQTSLSDATMKPILQALHDGSQGFENVEVADFSSLVCPDGICRAQAGGMIVYRDDMHLTNSYVATLAPQVLARLGLAPAAPASDSAPEGD